jgi:hypothetical protein
VPLLYLTHITSGISLGVELLDHVSSLFSFFEEPPYCFYSGCTNLQSWGDLNFTYPAAFPKDTDLIHLRGGSDINILQNVYKYSNTLSGF